MGKIKILSDDGNVYKNDEVVDVADLIRSYCDCTNDNDLKDWLWKIPIQSAVDFITKAWGIEYKYI